MPTTTVRFDLGDVLWTVDSGTATTPVSTHGLNLGGSSGLWSSTVTAHSSGERPRHRCSTSGTTIQVLLRKALQRQTDDFEQHKYPLDIADDAGGEGVISNTERTTDPLDHNSDDMDEGQGYRQCGSAGPRRPEDAATGPSTGLVEMIDEVSGIRERPVHGLCGRAGR